MRRILIGFCLVALLWAALSMWQPKSAASAISTLSNLTHNMSLSNLTLPGSQGSSSVEGPPTISAAFIDSVLAHAGSPAKGTGQALYQDALQYGIDDAYALAFFQHESTFGTTGVATVTLSLGNIRCTPGYQCIEGYRAYQSWQEGYEDWYKLIRNLYIDKWGLRTVQAIIPVYAPASDHNDVPGYIAAVENAVKVWRTGKFASAGVKLAA
jgi:hypothetical protein